MHFLSGLDNAGIAHRTDDITQFDFLTFFDFDVVGQSAENSGNIVGVFDFNGDAPLGIFPDINDFSSFKDLTGVPSAALMSTPSWVRHSPRVFDLTNSPLL